MGVKSITAAELLTRRDEGKPVDLIDVRTPAEYRELHAEGARSVPLDRLDPQAVMGSRNGEGAGPLYVICQSGSRARQACEKLAAAGVPNAVLVEDG
ncbi:MAG TPA: rhodanese-like domain-containing protein, partial [Gemmataceae bacterium]|nr:rhodanese-like domain-containing protein [Gemmataceae bacterium]